MPADVVSIVGTEITTIHVAVELNAAIDSPQRVALLFDAERRRIRIDPAWADDDGFAFNRRSIVATSFVRRFAIPERGRFPAEVVDGGIEVQLPR
jgi:hypothetical protein